MLTRHRCRRVGLRLATLKNVTAWVEAHGREPQMSGELSERLMANQLKALRTRASRELLASQDRLGLLNDNQR